MAVWAAERRCLEWPFGSATFGSPKLGRTTADSFAVLFDAPAYFQSFCSGQFLTLRATIDRPNVQR
jgi:hypothetical protein